MWKMWPSCHEKNWFEGQVTWTYYHRRISLWAKVMRTCNHEHFSSRPAWLERLAMSAQTSWRVIRLICHLHYFHWQTSVECNIHELWLMDITLPRSASSSEDAISILKILYGSAGCNIETWILWKKKLKWWITKYYYCSESQTTYKKWFRICARKKNGIKAIKHLCSKEEITLQRGGMESCHHTWVLMCTWPTSCTHVKSACLRRSNACIMAYMMAL